MSQEALGAADTKGNKMPADRCPHRDWGSEGAADEERRQGPPGSDWESPQASGSRGGARSFLMGPKSFGVSASDDS